MLLRAVASGYEVWRQALWKHASVREAVVEYAIRHCIIVSVPNTRCTWSETRKLSAEMGFMSCIQCGPMLRLNAVYNLTPTCVEMQKSVEVMKRGLEGRQQAAGVVD